MAKWLGSVGVDTCESLQSETEEVRSKRKRERENERGKELGHCREQTVDWQLADCNCRCSLVAQWQLLCVPVPFLSLVIAGGDLAALHSNERKGGKRCVLVPYCSMQRARIGELANWANSHGFPPLFQASVKTHRWLTNYKKWFF